MPKNLTVKFNCEIFFWKKSSKTSHKKLMYCFEISSKIQILKFQFQNWH